MVRGDHSHIVSCGELAPEYDLRLSAVNVATELLLDGGEYKSCRAVTIECSALKPCTSVICW